MKALAITLGDPNGVGPEILVRGLANIRKDELYVIYGDEEIIRAATDQFAPGLGLAVIDHPDQAQGGRLNILSPGILSKKGLLPGNLRKEAGATSLEYVRRAAEDTAQGLTSGMVTLPVNKEAVRLSSPDFTGHTGFIAGLVGGKASMLLAGDALCVSHVSTHCSLKTAIELVQKERIEAVVRLTWETLTALGKADGDLAVAALNPHAGEGGAFGDEEIREIAPAIRTVRNEGIPVVGPIAPDTVFHSALKGRYVGVVCMYHDQGHIPMKTVDFEGGVNISMGLPIVRTSVDHGTAFDIAWQGIASTDSFLTAIKYARALIETHDK